MELRHLFLFGTLLHRPLFDVVAGERGDWQPAHRVGYRVAQVQDQVFPAMVQGGAGAEGVVVTGLSDRALDRLHYYEAAFGYVPHEITVTLVGGKDIRALAYLPEPDRWQASASDWSLADWTRDWAEVTVETALEAMTLHGVAAPDVMGRRYPTIMARAASRLRARALDPSGGMGQGDVHLHALRRPYMNHFAAEEMDLSFRRFDGAMSDPVERAVWSVGDVSIVLPYDPTRDRVLLIEQFRPGPYRRGDPSPWILEPVAGRIDPGETPEEAARREAKEETGLTLKKLELVADSYPSPGTTTEHFHIYLGLADLPDHVAGVGGKLSEAEDIRSHLLDWAAFDARLTARDFRLVPLELLGHWLARNRDRLRASA